MINTKLETSKTWNTAEQAKRGETRNTGFFTVEDGEESAFVEDVRCGMGKVVLLMPMNEAAGKACHYVSEVSNGYFEVVVDADVLGDKAFGYAIFGENNNRA